jgi:hypothetical protein
MLDWLKLGVGALAGAGIAFAAGLGGRQLPRSSVSHQTDSFDRL